MPCQHMTIPYTQSFVLHSLKWLIDKGSHYFLWEIIKQPLRLQCSNVFLDSQPRHCCALSPPIAPSYTSSHPKQFLFPPCTDMHTLCMSEKGGGGGGATQEEHANMVLVTSAGKKIALEVLSWCCKCERRRGYLLLCWFCLTHCDVYSISSGDLRNFTKLSDRQLDLTKRCTCIQFPFTKHWWQANMVSMIFWIRNEHRAVKWYQGLSWGR